MRKKERGMMWVWTRVCVNLFCEKYDDDARTVKIFTERTVKNFTRYIF